MIQLTDPKVNANIVLFEEELDEALTKSRQLLIDIFHTFKNAQRTVAADKARIGGFHIIDIVVRRENGEPDYVLSEHKGD